jgi:Tol biopolymer transport system component
MLRWLLSLVSAASMVACAEADTADEAGAPEALGTELESVAPAPAAVTVDCFVYKCPQTGRTYTGATDYAARHRCELSCGNFCTFVENLCILRLRSARVRPRRGSGERARPARAARAAGGAAAARKAPTLSILTGRRRRAFFIRPHFVLPGRCPSVAWSVTTSSSEARGHERLASRRNAAHAEREAMLSYRSARRAALAAAFCLPGAAAHAQTNLPTQLVAYPSPSSYNPLTSASADGRYIAYKYLPNSGSGSWAGNIYVYDRVTNTTVQVDITPAGAPALPKSDVPVISGDGRYVLFSSSDPAMGLPPGASMAGYFVRDLQAGTTELVVAGKDNVSCCTLRLRATAFAGLSPTGRYVVYRIEDNDGVVPAKLYLWDSTTKATTLLNAPNAEFYSLYEHIDISTDGRYVSYTGRPLHPLPINDLSVWRHDRLLNTTTLVNVDNAGVRRDPAMEASMSDDGSVVAFRSSNRNFGPVPETSDNNDVFVRDLNAGTTERVSFGVGAQLSYQPSLSADGRYVAYQGYAAPNGKNAIWLYDRQAKAARGGLPSGLSNSIYMQYPTVSTDGRYVSMYTHKIPAGVPSNRFIAVLDYGEPAAVLLSANALALTEGGVAGTYTVVLSRAPSANVTVLVNADAQVSRSASQLLFTSTNWNVPQTVSIEAVQDNTSEGGHASLVTHATVTTDPFFKVAQTGVVQVAIADAAPPPVVAPTVVVPGTPGQPLPSGDVPLTGTAAPNATVLLEVTDSATGAVHSATVVADGQGNWAYTYLGLANGVYTVQAEADGLDSPIYTFMVKQL